MTCFRKYILQLLVSVVFLQYINCCTKECHAAYLQILLLFRVIFKIFMVFELFETNISKLYNHFV